MTIQQPSSEADVRSLAKMLYDARCDVNVAYVVANVPSSTHVVGEPATVRCAVELTYNAFAEMDDHDVMRPLFISPFGVESDDTFTVTYAAGVTDIAELADWRDPRVRHYEISAKYVNGEYDILASDVTARVLDIEDDDFTDYRVPFDITRAQERGEDR